MCFVAGSLDKAITGAQVEEIAARMKESADRVTALASGRDTLLSRLKPQPQTRLQHGPHD